MLNLNTETNRHQGALWLTRLISRNSLRFLRQLFYLLTLVAGTLALLPNLFSSLLPLSNLSLGLFFIFLAFSTLLFNLSCYHNYFYYFGLHSILGLKGKRPTGISFEVAEALLGKEEDLTRAFILSKLGYHILLRTGLDAEQINTYLASVRPKLASNLISLKDGEIFTLISLGTYLLKQDPTFAEFLKTSGSGEENFLGALKWVVIAHHESKRTKRWWGRDNLSKTQGIGAGWSYGQTYLLKQFTKSLRTNAVFSNLVFNHSAFTKEKVEEIEIALSRAKAANVLIIGEAGAGTIDLLLKVEERMAKGEALQAIEDKEFIALDTDRLFATNRDKSDLELTLLNLLSETTHAGNIVLVIENISKVIREAENYGIFLPELLDPFLASEALHLIVTDTPSNYHTYLENLGSFTRRFAEVLVDTPSLSSTIAVLQEIARGNEGRYGIMFTYPALTAIASSADRYLVDGVMPEKAIELLIDIATRAKTDGYQIVKDEYVYKVVSTKTGIPAGPIGEAERDLLLNLEQKLHERVIGQESALIAIAKTMRRARVGIQDANKPIGSFLFLGPTGVGKTETAKALAYIFFGEETKMLRFDMSEFSGNDGLLRLIGTGEQPGLLASQLNEHPYTVLLLDEFEKASTAVHDLFLQILDEGIFTDGHGRKINARNTIIIATSNAGSDLIARTVEQRQKLATLTNEIIEHIIQTGVYRRELINRFASTIIFEPLTSPEQTQVAGLMLKDLYQRLKERGFDLVINKDLLDVLVEKGYQPQFGARGMQRVIQDLIEEKVAQKMISGNLPKGSTITLSRDDFLEAELIV